MEDTPQVQSEPRPASPPHRPALGNILSFVVGLVGVGALAASAWVYTETQRDIVRLSTDIAQLRVSMELFGRQQGAPSGTDNANLQDLSNRLAIIEQSWRDSPPTAAPVEAAIAPAPSAEAAGGDCLPVGTRFMVAAGDRWPVCGTGSVVEIGAVDNGFISLADGTVIAQGGTIALPGGACMIGVLPAEGTALSGFAEIRVTC